MAISSNCSNIRGVPAVDDIYYLGRSNPGYKIVTSAASNWDKPVVFAETYAAYGQNMNEKIAYKVAMDQHAMGVNIQLTSGGQARTAYAPEFNRFYSGRMEISCCSAWKTCRRT